MLSTFPTFRQGARQILSATACSFFLISVEISVLTLASAAEQRVLFAQRYPKTSPSPAVGSAMAVLATLDEAQVLPPEGTREADRIVKSVIQFQSAFAKSRNSSVQEFVHRAVTARENGLADKILRQFHSHGWTAEVLEALAEADLRTPPVDFQALVVGLGQFNLTVDDFRNFMQLIRDSQHVFAARGKTFREIYASHRMTMPGAAER